MSAQVERRRHPDDCQRLCLIAMVLGGLGFVMSLAVIACTLFAGS
jgi:hypothetical protein